MHCQWCAVNAQRLFAELLVRPDLVAELRADPTSFAREHGVDMRLCGRLADLPEKGMRITAAITRHQRAQKVTVLFPGTFVLARQAGVDAMLLQVTEAHGQLSAGAEAVEVGRRLAKAASCAAETDDPPSLLAEMIEFETLCQQALASAGAPDASPSPPAPAPGVVFTTLARPLPRIRRQLFDGTPPGDPAEAGTSASSVAARSDSTSYALQADERSGQVRCHRLPQRLARLLFACNGIRDLPELSVAADLPESTAAHTLRSMVGKGLITWSDSTPPMTVRKR